MALYLIGDVQGCDEALGRLLDALAFSPSRDQLLLLGDVVNRGPSNAAVMARLVALDGAAQALLGNHDLHWLALAHGVGRPGRRDTLHDVLHHPQRTPWVNWMLQRPLALQVHGWLCVHAGVFPQWSAEQTLALAHEVQQALGERESRQEFFAHMYANNPNQWSEGLTGVPRWRAIVNGLTRMRLCSASGVMDFDIKEDAARAPEGLMPWFEVPDRATAHTPMAFGHWSTLRGAERAHLLPLDTGCVWGGCLSAVELCALDGAPRWHHVDCAAAQNPRPA
jgi:bis(5'-nucleosyl)-tetraphosphatase (symmetrical)